MSPPRSRTCRVYSEDAQSGLEITAGRRALSGIGAGCSRSVRNARTWSGEELIGIEDLSASANGPSPNGGRDVTLQSLTQAGHGRARITEHDAIWVRVTSRPWSRRPADGRGVRSIARRPGRPPGERGVPRAAGSQGDLCRFRASMARGALTRVLA